MDSSLKRYCRFLLLLTMVASLFACATSTQRVPDSETAAVLALLRQCGDDIQTAKGVGGLVLNPGSGEKQRSRFAWVVERSSALRLEILGLWGRPVYRFLLRGDAFWLHDVGADEYFRGPAKGRALKRVLGFAVNPRHLQSILLGCMPLVSFRKAVLDKPGEGGGVELSLYGRWGRRVQKVHFAADGVSATRAEFFGVDEELRYTVTVHRFQTTQNGRVFPDSIRIVGSNGAGILMDIGSVAVNAPVSPHTFQMGMPQ